MFYTYSQNNSGGVFHHDFDVGIAECVIIEAESLEAANRKAKSIGIYFNGCSKGLDCNCCGDRWNEPWDDEGNEVPTHFHRNVLADGAKRSFVGEKYSTAIHYADGRMELL